MKVQLDQHSRYESEEKWWLVMEHAWLHCFEDFSNSDNKNVNAADPQNVLMKINFIEVSLVKLTYSNDQNDLETQNSVPMPYL